MSHRGFTVLELLVVVAILATMLSVALPMLSSARTHARALACASNARQIALATDQYLREWRECLPQVRVPLPEGGAVIRGTTFAGKRGEAPIYGLSEAGIGQRPLNPYLLPEARDIDDRHRVVDVMVCRSPCDRGARELSFGLPEFDRNDSMYDVTGTSYVLNDHTLDGDFAMTLIPEGGGRMPVVRRPSYTWLVGSSPIYNFQQDTDRGQRWYDPVRCEVNLTFVDLHTKIRVAVPDQLCVVENETEHYSFLP